jgi:hypothetical protein
MLPHVEDLDCLFDDELTSEMHWQDANGTVLLSRCILRSPEALYSLGSIEVEDARRYCLMPNADAEGLHRYAVATIANDAYTVLAINRNAPHHGIAKIYLGDATAPQHQEDSYGWS